MKELSDERVLERVEVLVARSNEITAELLSYLAEVDARGLHLREACGSLFAFCVERLHMSEGAAGKRITAMRTARRFPLVFEMVSRGEIHLSGLSVLGPHLTEENHAELLGRARHRSKREIERLAAEVAPRPDVRSRVAALPFRVARDQTVAGAAPVVVAPAVVAQPAAEACGSAGGERAPGRAASAAAARPAAVEPLSSRRYQIRVTVDEETHRALCQLQDLLSHQVPDRDPAVIISRALESLLERTLARKAAVTERPREGRAPDKRTRHIPAAVRREVWKRDAGRCAFVDPQGRRCSSTRFLEFHHRENWGRGADHEPGEIELRCRAHNQYQAELDYGAEFMAGRRFATASRAREPRRPYVASASRRHLPRSAGDRLQWRNGVGATVEAARRGHAARRRLLDTAVGGVAGPGERGPPRRAGRAAADRHRLPARLRAQGAGGHEGRPPDPGARAGDARGRVAVESQR